MWLAVKQWLFVSTCLVAISIAVLWIVSCFTTFHLTTTSKSAVTGIAIKHGFIDIEYSTFDLDYAAHRFGAFLIRQDDGRLSLHRRFDPHFNYREVRIVKSVDHAVDHYKSKWHDQFLKPVEFVQNRWGACFLGTGSSGIVLLLEIPFSILLFAAAYWPAIRLLRSLRGREVT